MEKEGVEPPGELPGVLPDHNDGGFYLYMTGCGLTARINASPKQVTHEMSTSVRSQTGILPIVKVAAVWPLVLLIPVLPFLVKLKPVEDGFRENVLHFSVIHPITQILILSSVPKLISTVTGAVIHPLEEVLVVLIGAFVSTALVMMAGGVGAYPIPFAPFLTTVPSSWLVFLLLFFIVRPQFKTNAEIKKRFVVALHVHNLFYVGGAVILLYTLVFRMSEGASQRMVALLLPVFRFVVRKGLELLMVPISPDLMGISMLLAEFSVQSLVTSMLPGLKDIGTVLFVVILDLLSNVWRAFMGTSLYLKAKFKIMELIGGASANPNHSRGFCSPFVRASFPPNSIVANDLEDPSIRFSRHVYNTAILVALELADILAPIVYMSIVSIIHVSGNTASMGLGPKLHPTTDQDIVSGWKWVALLSGLELGTAIILGMIVFRQSGINIPHVVRILVADSMNFLARMIFSKYVFLLTILLTHSGTLSFLD